MTAFAILELTLSAEGNGVAASGNTVLVPLPFDHIEQRSHCTYVRTAGGSDLYVRETISQIKASLASLAPTSEEPHGSS